MNINYRSIPNRGESDDYESQLLELEEMRERDELEYEEFQSKRDRNIELAIARAEQELDEREFNVDLGRITHTRGHLKKSAIADMDNKAPRMSKPVPKNQLKNKEFGKPFTVVKKVTEILISGTVLTRQLASSKFTCKCTVKPQDFLVSINHLNSCAAVLKDHKLVKSDTVTGLWVRIDGGHLSSPYYFMPVSRLNGNNGSWTNTDDHRRFHLVQPRLNPVDDILMRMFFDILQRQHDHVLATFIHVRFQIRRVVVLGYSLYVSNSMYETLFSIVSDLNGNNGEWTNGDDVTCLDHVVSSYVLDLACLRAETRCYLFEPCYSVRYVRRFLLARGYRREIREEIVWRITTPDRSRLIAMPVVRRLVDVKYSTKWVNFNNYTRRQPHYLLAPYGIFESHYAIRQFQPSINGNNGEWTNGDDLADLHNAKRLQDKSFFNKQFRKKLNVPRVEHEDVVVGGPIRNFVASMSDTELHAALVEKNARFKAAFDAQRMKKAEPDYNRAPPGFELDPRIEAISNMARKAQNKTNAYKRVTNAYIEARSDHGQSDYGGDSLGSSSSATTSDVPVEVFHHIMEPGDVWCTDGTQVFGEPVFGVLPPGVYPDVVSSGPGWMVTLEGSKPKLTAVFSFLEYFHVPEYLLGMVVKPKQRFYLPKLVVEFCDKKVRFSTLTLTNVNALTGCVLKIYRNLPVSLQDACTFYFGAIVSYNECRTSRLMSTVPNMRNNPYAVLISHEYDTFDEDTEVLDPFRVDSIACEENFVYEEVEDVDIHGQGICTVPQADGGVHHAFQLNGFPEPVRLYDTVMFSCQGARKFAKYDNSAVNMNKALKRLLAKTENHDQRVNNQNDLAGQFAAYCKVSEGIKKACKVPNLYCTKPLDGVSDAMHHMKHTILSRFERSTLEYLVDLIPNNCTWAYYNVYQKYLVNFYEPRALCAEIKHVKQKLRECYVKNKGKADLSDLMVKRLKAMIKVEIAKPRKAPRLYVGYDAGCMYANELPEYVKVCIHGAYHFTHGRDNFQVYCFAKPDMAEIQAVFSEIAQGLPCGEHIICIYSDDSVYAGHTHDGQRYSFNVDISSCDASCGSLVFLTSCIALGNFDEEKAIGLVEQCCLPITLHNPNVDNSYMSISFPNRPFEGSGTVLTTINNHFISLWKALTYIFSGDYSAGGISAAALKVGLIVTCSDNFESCPEKIQFLKYSPMRSFSGKWVMTRNMGCIFRSLGRVDQDMTPEQLGMGLVEFNLTNWNTRMNLFTSSVVKSYIHEPSSPMVDALRLRFTSPAIQLAESYTILANDNKYESILPESICARYDITPVDLERVSQKVLAIKLGTVIVDDVFTHIYSVDYDL